MTRRDIKKHVQDWMEGHPDLVVLATNLHKAEFGMRESLPDILARCITQFDEKRDRDHAASKQEAKQELYAHVDELVEKVFKEKPNHQDGDCERLTIDLGIGTYDDDGNPLVSYYTKKTSIRSGY